MAKKKKPPLHYDDQGEFRWETFFVGGKQKRRKIRVIEGIDAHTFIERNADDIWLLQNEEYVLLHTRQMERERQSEGDGNEGGLLSKPDFFE